MSFLNNSDATAIGVFFTVTIDEAVNHSARFLSDFGCLLVFSSVANHCFVA